MKQLNIQILVIIPSLLSVSLVACSHKATEPSEISLKQAEQSVFSQMLSNNDSGIVVYELPTQMKSGAVVTQRGPDSTQYVAPSDSWFFFIDDKPTYRWTHPCRYAFVACADGKHTVFNEGFPPSNIDSLRVVTFN